MFDKRQKPYKQIAMGDIEQIDGVWTPRKIVVKNLRPKRMSVMILNAIGFNISVPEQLFTQRALIDFAYRERELESLRQHLL